MSKMDNLRAMREARFERSSTQPARRPSPAPEKREAPAPAPAAEVGEELCGHRAISGRTCTRERGHSAKSHRYG